MGMQGQHRQTGGMWAAWSLGESADGQEVPKYTIRGQWCQEIKEVDRDRIRKTSCHRIIFEHYPMGSEELMNNSLK